MASSNPLSWSAFYARNRDDKGVFQTFFDTHLGTRASRSKLHLRDVAKFTETITGSATGNALIVAGAPGRMNLLHHGFSCLTDGDFSLVFVQGNLSDCSYFKILPREAAVEEVRVVNGQRVTTTNCPTLEAMLGARTADEFKDLPAQGNGVLRQRPNHLLINGDVFLMVEGAPSFSAKELAINVIEFVRPVTEGDEEDDDDMLEAKREASAESETLLAMLWACENNGLTAVPLEDVPSSPALIQIIRNVKGKLTTNTAVPLVPVVTLDDTAARTDRTDKASAWEISSQSIVQELNRMHESREAERVQKNRICPYLRHSTRLRRSCSLAYVPPI